MGMLVNKVEYPEPASEPLAGEGGTMATKSQGLKAQMGMLSKDMTEMRLILEKKPQNENGFARLKELAVNIKIGIETAKAEIVNYKAGNVKDEDIKKYRQVLDIADTKIRQCDMANAKSMSEAVEMAKNVSSRTKEGKGYNFNETLGMLSRAFAEIEAALPKEGETERNGLKWELIGHSWGVGLFGPRYIKEANIAAGLEAKSGNISIFNEGSTRIKWATEQIEKQGTTDRQVIVTGVNDISNPNALNDLETMFRVASKNSGHAYICNIPDYTRGSTNINKMNAKIANLEKKYANITIIDIAGYMKRMGFDPKYLHPEDYIGTPVNYAKLRNFIFAEIRNHEKELEKYADNKGQ